VAHKKTRKSKRPVEMSPESKEQHPALNLCRGAFAATLVAEIRLMQGFSSSWTFALGYILLVLLGAEVYFDLLRNCRIVIRCLGLLPVIALLILFTYKVVKAPAPLEITILTVGIHRPGTVLAGIDWTPDLTDVQVSVADPLDDDYEDVDLTIRLDYLDAPMINGIGQVTNIPGVTFLGPGARVFQQGGKPPFIVWDFPTGHTVGDKITFQGRDDNKPDTQPRALDTNYKGVRFDKLPRRQAIILALAVPTDELPKAKKAWIKARYSAKYRVRNIDQFITLGQ
jgi:hypothetical protein